MKRLALFFAIAGLFALAACDPIVGPIDLGCSAPNCPPPGSCQPAYGDTIFDGIPVCTPPNASTSATVTMAALLETGRQE